VAADYRRLLDFARVQIPGRRCSAVEGAGSYGAGLTRLLVERGEWVVEADRPKRPARRGGKSGREIRRCVKRAIARQLFKLLQQLTASTPKWSGSASRRQKCCTRLG
jgi:hypothetical protein